MDTIYPTKKEILHNIDMFPPEEKYKQVLQRWKKGFYTKKWNKKTTEEKQIALQELITEMYTIATNQQPPSIYWGEEWAYDPLRHIIIGKESNLSIVSTLHEIGHAIFGHSELKACTFSVSLFQEIFPKEYENLEWRGHMLYKIKK